MKVLLLSCRDAGDIDVAKFGFLSQVALEDNVDDTMLGIGLEAGLYLRLEIAFLTEEAEKALAVLLDGGRVIWSLRGVVGDLNKTGVGVTFGAGELKDAVVDSRVENEE